MARLTADDLRALAASVGLSGERQRIAVAVALAESGGNTAAIGDGGKSIGLWQIHTGFHPQYDRGALMTPSGNAKAMMAISGGGTNWQPWSVYKNGTYKQYLNQAGTLSNLVAPEGSTLGNLAGAADGVVRGGLDVAGGALGSIGDLAGVLTNPEWWRRVGVGAAGVALVVVGGLWVLRDVAGPSLAKLPGPIGAAAKVAT